MFMTEGVKCITIHGGIVSSSAFCQIERSKIICLNTADLLEARMVLGHAEYVDFILRH